MVAPIPKTIKEELFNSINELIYSCESFTHDSISIRKLLNQADKLMPVEPGEANVIKAMIYQLCWDVESVHKHVKIASKLPLDNRSNANLNFSVAYLNLGFYSLGQFYFNLLTEPDQAYSDHIINAGLGSLSFNKLNTLIIKGKEINLNFDEKMLQLNQQAVNLLNKHHITDADVAMYADVFGEVLNENKFFQKTQLPVIIVDDKDNNEFGSDTLFVVFKIDTDPKTASVLNKEAIKRLFAKFDLVPDSIHFSIEAF